MTPTHTKTPKVSISVDLLVSAIETSSKWQEFYKVEFLEDDEFSITPTFGDAIAYVKFYTEASGSNIIHGDIIHDEESSPVYHLDSFEVLDQDGDELHMTESQREAVKQQIHSVLNSLSN